MDFANAVTRIRRTLNKMCTSQRSKFSWAARNYWVWLYVWSFFLSCHCHCFMSRLCNIPFYPSELTGECTSQSKWFMRLHDAAQSKGIRIPNLEHEHLSVMGFFLIILRNHHLIPYVRFFMNYYDNSSTEKQRNETRGALETYRYNSSLLQLFLSNLRNKTTLRCLSVAEDLWKSVSFLIVYSQGCLCLYADGWVSLQNIWE